MSVLSDKTLRNLLTDTLEDQVEDSNMIYLSPYNPSLVQPCSIDVRLGREVLFPPSENVCFIDDNGPENLMLDPLEFCLAHTLETVSIPNNILCTISGKSSLGRLGLSIHTTAGFIDPGFKGQITLELFNMSSRPIRLVSGMLIAQLSFQCLDRAAEFPYGSAKLNSHYQGQTGATPSSSLDTFSILGYNRGMLTNEQKIALCDKILGTKGIYTA